MAATEPARGRLGFGRRSALVVLDLALGFTDPESPLHCDLDTVIEETRRLLASARRAGIPIVYSTVAYSETGRQLAAAFLEKIPVAGLLETGSRLVAIDPRVAPAPGEPVLERLFPSAFSGTALSSFLTASGCDTVVLAGASTSGAVRATALDALQHGYRPIVPREAVGDRDVAVHEANLLDIDAKCADVVSLDEVLAYLTGLAAPS
ncbi:MAG: isochorismatase family protein [Thermoleophilia bacterium]|nr:isochorismatase family protein [Thermoleophilia bacterium]